MRNTLITFLALGFIFASCEFDKGFEEMNINPNAAAQIGVGNKFAKTILDTSGGRYENWRNSFIYNSTLIQHHATLAGYWSGDKYYRVDSYATSLWDRNYPSAVKGIEDIIQQLKDEGNSGSEMGMARILRVFIYHRITDTHGDIPYSEAGKGYIDGTLKPKYDPQQDIYMDMLKELEEAVAQIGGSSTMGVSDVIFGGNTTKWKAWGNSMMLRLAMRMTKADAASAQAWAVKAISGGTMTSNDHIAMVRHTDGPEGINKNGHGEVFLVDSQARMSDTFGAHLAGDPRLSVLFEPGNDATTIVGMPNGRTGSDYTDQSGNTVAGIPNRHIYAQPNAAVRGMDVPMVFQTYAEVEFLKAEAAIRGWTSGDAKTHYENGVKAAMMMLKDIYPSSTAITAAEADAYLAGPGAYDASKGWEQCMNEYWKATYLNEYEAYANWRRTGYPTLTATKHPNSETSGQIMRRMIYPGGEASTNGDSYNAAVARQGADTWMTRMWWDK
jgi:hypothetical protein